MILIRADGNPHIGSGHIMRCLSLADALRDAGQSVIFLTADGCFQNLIQIRGYECDVLHTRYDDMQGELPMLLPLLKRRRPDLVVMDSYFVTPDYMRAVKRETPLIYIDDQNSFDYPADLVLNYMLYSEKLSYPQNKPYLLGPQYALLRKEFQDIAPRQAAEQVGHILLSTGGADSEHTALGCVRYLRERPAAGVTYHVILGGMNPDGAEIRRLAAGHSHILLHQQVSDMRALMLECDAAVSAGGTTLFELCACGLPTVTYALADNQLMNMASFEEAGLMLSAGDIRQGGRPIQRIFARLDLLTGDWALRKRTAERMQALIDGCGAARSAEALRKLIGK